MTGQNTAIKFNHIILKTERSGKSKLRVKSASHKADTLVCTEDRRHVNRYKDKEKMLSSCILFLVTLKAVHSVRVDVHFEDYNQNVCLTQCMHNLLVNNVLYLTATVTVYSKREINKGSIILKIKGKNDSVYHEFKNIFIKECNTPDLEFNCFHDDKENMYKITLNKTVTENLSETTFKIEASLLGTKNTSNEITIPAIYDPKKIVVELNNYTVTDETHSLTLANSSVTLCCKNAPTPCYVVIWHEDHEIKERSNCLTYTIPMSDVYYIGYYVCQDGRYTRRYTVNITLESISESKGIEVHNYFLSWSLGGGGVVIVAGVIIFILVVLCYIRSKKNSTYAPVRKQPPEPSVSSDSTNVTLERTSQPQNAYSGITQESDKISMSTRSKTRSSTDTDNLRTTLSKTRSSTDIDNLSKMNITYAVVSTQPSEPSASPDSTHLMLESCRTSQPKKTNRRITLESEKISMTTRSKTRSSTDIDNLRKRQLTDQKKKQTK